MSGDPLNRYSLDDLKKTYPRPMPLPEAMEGSDEMAYGKAKKRLFIGLVTGTSTLVCLFLVSLWIVPYIGLKNIHPAAPRVFGGLVFALIFLVAWASFGLVLNVAFGKTMPFFKRMRGVTVKLFLPLMTLLGRIVGLSREKVQSSFIKVNNELVVSDKKLYRPGEILLLMPHCLQRSDCTVRLTYGVHNCKGCGKCPMTDLIALSRRYGVHLDIATGGTIARRIVVQKRPKLIIAVACERDLSSGIQDTYPLPVYGILNTRPFGPCFNTQVSLDQLESALRYFIFPGHLPGDASGETSPGKKPRQKIDSAHPLKKSNSN